MLAVGALPQPLHCMHTSWMMADADPRPANSSIAYNTGCSNGLEQGGTMPALGQGEQPQVEGDQPSATAYQNSAQQGAAQIVLHFTNPQGVPAYTVHAPGYAGQPDAVQLKAPMPASPHTNTLSVASPTSSVAQMGLAAMTPYPQQMSNVPSSGGRAVVAGQGLIMTHPQPRRSADAAADKQDARGVDSQVVAPSMSSRFHGVTWYKASRRWQARLCTGRKQFHLGYYKSEEEAARAYDRAMLQHAGPRSSQLNFPEEASTVLESIKEEQQLIKTHQNFPGPTHRPRPDSGALLHTYRHKPPHRGPHMTIHPSNVRPSTSAAALTAHDGGASTVGLGATSQALPPVSATPLTGVTARDMTPHVLEAASAQPVVPGFLIPGTGEFLPCGTQGMLQVYEYVWDGSQLQLQRAMVGGMGPPAAAQEQLAQQQQQLVQQQQLLQQLQLHHQQQHEIQQRLMLQISGGQPAGQAGQVALQQSSLPSLRLPHLSASPHSTPGPASPAAQQPAISLVVVQPTDAAGGSAGAPCCPDTSPDHPLTQSTHVPTPPDGPAAGSEAPLQVQQDTA